MAIRKFDDLANETDSKFNNVKSTKKRTNITERFDDSTDNDNPYDDALQYINKKMDQCIDTINANNTASGSLEARVKDLTTASGSFSTRVTSNDAKVSSVFPTLTTSSPGTTASITGLAHAPGAKADTLTITVSLTTSKGTTQKQFRLTSI
tara:strand:- start:1486 stop:1938 length:453 start_codon:yes stop_codon:yes gene_type:complete